MEKNRKGLKHPEVFFIKSRPLKFKVAEKAYFSMKSGFSDVFVVHENALKSGMLAI